MGSSTTTTQNNRPFKPAQPLIGEGLDAAQALYAQGGFNIDPFQGNLVSDFDPLRQASVGQAPGVTNQALQGATNAFGTVNRAMDPNQVNAGLAGVQQNIIERIAPVINSSFAGSGQTGSALHQQNLAKGLASGLATPTFNAFNQAQDRGLNAAGLLPSIGQGAFGALQQQNQLGAGRQAQEQAGIQANVLQDQQAQTADLNAIQDYLSLTTGVGGMFGVQSSRQQQNPGFLGILGAGLQAAPFLSDRRLKENIRRVGKTDYGLPIYVYNYKGQNVTIMGVMADEVEDINPDAVGEIAGYKAVYYGAL